MKKIKHKANVAIKKEEIYFPIRILKENVLFFILLFFATIALYGNTINGDFLSADDLPGIVNNTMVKNFPASLKAFEVEKVFPALVYKVFGMNQVVFHTFSISMHFINAVLVFVLIMILFGKTEAVITTLIFLMHPI